MDVRGVGGNEELRDLGLPVVVVDVVEIGRAHV